MRMCYNFVLFIDRFKLFYIVNNLNNKIVERDDDRRNIEFNIFNLLNKFECQ